LTSLQFGHDLSAVETVVETVKRKAVKPSFNSATTFQPWKRVETASNTTYERSRLQFGHDLSAVET